MTATENRPTAMSHWRQLLRFCDQNYTPPSTDAAGVPTREQISFQLGGAHHVIEGMGPGIDPTPVDTLEHRIDGTPASSAPYSEPGWRGLIGQILGARLIFPTEEELSQWGNSQTVFPALEAWLLEIAPDVAWDQLVDCSETPAQPDPKWGEDAMWQVCLQTGQNSYFIVAQPTDPTGTYLDAVAETEHAGGLDIADGEFSEATWNRIICAILSYEVAIESKVQPIQARR